MEALLRFDNVSKQYPNGVHALNGVSFTVGEGEFISVIGPSGSGKSTLLRAINRLIPISGGTVLPVSYTHLSSSPRACSKATAG